MKKVTLSLFATAFILYSSVSTAAVTGLCGVLYVSTSGNSAGTGTPTSPVDLGTALTNMGVATTNIIRMQGGTYNYSPSATYSMPANTIIDGGYDASWLKNSGQTTILNITAPVQNISGTGQAIGLTFAGNNCQLQDLHISVAAASAQFNNYGVSIYGVYSNGNTGWKINRCVITTAAAGAGANGATGGGGAGGTGNASSNGSTTTGGYGGGCGGTGGTGANGNAGSAGSGGAAGGAGGNTGGGGGGGCCSGGTNTAGCGSNGCTANNGFTGGAGSNGAGYAAGTRPASSAFSTYYFPTQAPGGGGGGAGRQGGGGGGGAYGTCCTCSPCGSTNLSGGAGGAGGTGGAGGGGAYGGGASIAVYVYGGSGILNFTTITAGAAGTGGTGANGSNGSGGNGGSGGLNNGGCRGGNGGNGGTGGTGGTGGRGEDGANGVSQALVTANSASVTNSNAGTQPNPTTLTINYGSSSTSPKTAGCTNSEITLAESGGTFGGWTLPSGASYENDKTPTTSSFNTASASINVCFSTTTTGTDVLTGSGAANTYAGYAKIPSTNTLPTIGSPSGIPTICTTGTVNLTTPDNSLDAYNWAVDQTNCASPFYASSAQNNTNVSFVSVGTWYVRLRERSTCCGWSCPTYTTFTVVALPTIATQPQPQTVCTSTGPTALSIAVTGGVGTWTYQWYSNTVASQIGSSALIGTNSASYTPANVVGTTYYYVIATQSGSGCGSLTSNIVKVEVDAPSVGGTVFNGTTPICAGASPGSLLLTGQTGSVVNWNVNGTPIATTANPYSPGNLNVAGSYTYTATVQNGACPSVLSAGQTIQVDSGPVFTAPVNICVNSTVTLTSAVSNTTWSATNGSMSPTTGKTSVFTPSAFAPPTASRNAIVTATNGTCSFSQTIEVDNAPTISGIPTAICSSAGTIAVTSNVGVIWSATSGSFSPASGSASTYTLPAIAAPTASASVIDSATNGACVATTTLRVDNNPTIGGVPVNVCNTTSTVNVTSTITGTVWSVTGGGSFSPGSGTATTYTIPTVTPPTQNQSVTITATNGTCAPTAALEIDDNPTITSSNADLCQGSTVSLTNNIGNTGTWSGTGVSGSTFTAPNQASGTVSTSYTVTLTNGGCTATQNINSFNQPVISPAIPDLCAGGTYNLGLSSNLGAGGTWSGTGVSGSTFTATTTPTAPFQSFSVSLANVPCTAATQNVKVYALPTAYPVTGGGNVCPGSTSGGPQIFVSNSAVGVSYQLYLNGTTIIGAPVPGNGGSISLGSQNTPGTYTVVGSLSTSPFCSIQMLDSAVITAVPYPTAYAVTGGGAYCSGDTGRSVGLANTDLNISYYLYNGVTLIAGPVAGTGGPLNFGTYTAVGNYSATATNIAGCLTNMLDTVNIRILALPTIAGINAGSVTCFGGSDDTITISGTSFNGALHYSIDSGVSYPNTTGVFTGQTAGSYYVYVRDDSACTVKYVANPVVVNQPPDIFVSVASYSNVLCNGDSTGYINVSASGGVAPLTFAWSNGSTSQNISNLGIGNYTVTVTDGHNCQKTLSQLITQPNALTDSASGTNISCNGANDGTATVIAAGGTTPYKFQWSNGDTSQTITGLSAALYSVTVTDKNGCRAVSSYTVIDPPALSVSIAASNILCNGGNNGSITVTATGGTGVYSYTWSPNVSTTATASNIGPGTYYVTVSDANNCSRTDSAVITQPLAALSVSSIVTPVGCTNDSNGAIQLLPSGGAGGYTYSWSTGQALQIISSLPAGTYTGSVTDANGCVTSITNILLNPTPIVSSVVGTSSTCAGAGGGSATLTVSGGVAPYTFLWSNFETTQNLSNLSGGTYRVIITDANGCKHADSVTITQPLPLVISISSTNVACFGAATGTINVSVSGGTGTYSYAWTPNVSTTSTVTNASPGTYVVTVTDANLCSVTDSATITQPAAAISATAVVTPTTCNNSNNGSITLLVSGGTGSYTYSWTGGAITPTISNLAAGTYYVTVTDANGCTTVDSGAITNPTPITSTVTGTNVACAGGANGTASVTSVSGGTGPYTYLWSNFAATSTISNLSGGLYRVIITDANGCEHRDSVLITEPQPLVVTLSSTNANCAGSNNGTITAGVTGGTGAYSYAWTPNVSTTASVTNASPGTYVLTVTDANLCSVTDSVTITQPQGLSAVMTVTNVVCYGANNGSVTVNATGGSGVYTYTWAPVANATATLSNVGPGTYHVTVTDANGCTLVDSAKVRQPTSPIVITSVVHDITCYGVNDGSVLVVASGGTGSYTYIWSTGQTTQYVQGLSALPSPIVTPIYVVTVTDANGCTAVMRDTLHEPPQIISSVTGTDVTCAGANNGSVTLTVTGGRGAYTFFWSNFATTQNLTNIPGGFYTVVITDSSGCQNTDTITINQPQPLTLSIQSTNISCNGSNTGAITASVTGGTGAYQYTWSPNVSTTATVANAVAGTYRLTVTDANGCTITDSVTITQPAYPLSVTATVSNITCNNANNGAITLTVNGGSGFYTYAWTGSTATTSSINGLSAGTYTATVTDANGCTATAGGTITNPAAITSGIVATNVTCAGASNGSAILTVSGGTGAYTFQWSDATISQNLSNVPGGHYFVIITDSNGCRHEDSVTITEPQPLVGTITGTNVSCFGAANGTVTVSVTGGTGAYTYTWSPSVSTTATVSNAAPGTYSVTVKDANNCSIVKSITITQPVSGLLVQSNVVNISCSGNSNGSISLSVSGGTPAYTFLWGGGQQTQNISNLSAGIYHATVTDANGCSVVVADTVKVPTAITSSVTGTNVTCAGADNGTATLTVSGGQTPYTYLWSNFAGTQSVDSLSGGTYHVIITDANGCQHRDSVIISEPQPLVTTLAVTPISCNNTNDGTIIATTTGGTGNDTYLWAPGGQTSSTITNLSAGIYSVTVKDANNCTTSQFATLVNPAPLTAASVVINPTCNGSGNGTITLIVNGGTPQYGYVWSGGLTAGQSATNVAPGDYYVTVTDSHGCIATDSAKVIAPAPILVSAIITNVSCAGSMNGSIIATGYGGVLPYSYQWYADSINGPLGPITKDWTQVAGGNYFLVITDANNCSASFQAIVKEADSLKITLSKTDLTCYGANNGVVSVATTGGVTPYHYLWNDFTTDSSQTGIAAGTYGVVVTDSNGCQQTKTITVNQPQPISINLTATSPACSGANTGTIAVSANGGTGGYTYSWSTTPPQSTATASNLGAGTYYVTVSDGNSCSQVDSTTLSAPQALQVNTAISNPTCSDGDNGFISLDVHGGSAPYTYSWSTTPAQTGNVASGLAGGTYAATITDTRGCQYLDTALAVVAPQPIVITIGTVGGATCISSADGYAVVNVSGGLAPYTYQLGTLAQNSDTFGHLVPGSYSLSVKDANACTAITSWTIVTSSNFSVTLTADHDAILAGQPVQLTATPVSDTTVTAYIWTPSDSLNFSGCGNPSDCPNPIATPTASTTYIVQAQNARGCLATDTIHISVADQPSVFVPTAFTPNGDGLNDKFQFDILGATTINVQIWNRWGEKVFSNPAQSNGVNSTDGWDGTYRDKKAEYDTYTYQLVVTYFDGHQQTMAGTVVLMR